MRKRVLYILFLLLITGAVFSGDNATFRNLGFSPDSRYFMFAQYGINENSSSPYAETYIVDVPSNRFVPGGTRKLSSNKAVGPGNDGLGALFNLLEETIPVKRKYGIDHISTGRLLYILLDGEQPRERLEFRDFEMSRKYRTTLVQSSAGTGKNIKSCFHILLTVERKSGQVDNYTVGLPNYWRKGVKRYRIKQIMLAPDERSLIIVIEKEQEDSSGSDIRFMVETVKLHR